MATAYRCRDGDVLDWICWHWYGREDVLPQILEANPGLADLPQPLPAGTLIYLPEVSPPEQKGRVLLWE